MVELHPPQASGWPRVQHMIIAAATTLGGCAHERDWYPPCWGYARRSDQVMAHESLTCMSLSWLSKNFEKIFPAAHQCDPMRREHVYSKCTMCGWRQRSYTIKGKICFEEYYCLGCGGPLLICVEIRNDKGRNKRKDDDKHKRQKTKIMLLAKYLFAHDHP